MNELPSIWALPLGAIAGCLYIGRIGRWLQFVRAVMGKGSSTFAAELNPRPWKSTLAVVAYPTPWIALALAAWAIHHAVTVPLTSGWLWFYSGFFGGPILLMAFLMFKVRQIKRKRASSSIPP